MEAPRNRRRSANNKTHGLQSNSSDSINEEEVKKSETIQNVKAMLYEKEGFPENFQELFFAGNQLKDDSTLVDYDIPKDSNVLFLQNSVGMKIYVKIPSSQKTIVVETKTNDTIQNIKSIIQGREGIQSDQYTLHHAGKLLVDNRTLASLNIQRESTLLLVSNPIDILSIQTKNVFIFEVKLLHTVRDVKAMVESIANFPMRDWDLVYEGIRLEEWKTLASYDIKGESILEILHANAIIQVFVKTSRGTITIDTKRLDTVGM